MKRDIHKLGVWLEKVCQEGVALEQEISAWKHPEGKKQNPTPQAKAS
jgi:hypothetical protein